MSRKLEEMCVVCNDHNKSSCGFEERGSQCHCPYNDLIERGYRLAEQDLALTAEDVGCIFNLVRQMQVKYNATSACFQEVADIFNKDREDESR